MPVIPVNLSDVEAYSDLPVDEYAGQIDKIEWLPAKEQGKFPQLMITYAVIDGDQLGRKSSEFLSFSPKAAFRMKKWFDQFGFGDTENLDVDDDTNLLTEPDLIGVKVVFHVYQDGYRQGKPQTKGNERYRTELLTVDEDEFEAPAKAEKPEPEDSAEPEAEEKPKAARPVRPTRPAVAAGEVPKRRTLR